MTYSILKAPFELNFKEMKRERAREYLEWFIKQIPERILILTQYLKKIPKYSSWNGDLSPSSLDLLGAWFCENVVVQPKPIDEMGSIHLPTWLPKVVYQQNVITTMTMNLAIDVSMYFGETLIANNPNLHWGLATRPKKSADYQQPVLFGRGKIFLNPVRIISVYAQGIADKSQGVNRLRELYDIWSKNLNE